MSMNYWNDMPASYDAWLTTDVEGERAQQRADYCLDNHDSRSAVGGGPCPECEAEDAVALEGPDPDDVRDQRREQEWEDRHG